MTKNREGDDSSDSFDQCLRDKRLTNKKTGGGKIYSDSFGYGYVKALAQSFFGIEECVLIAAEGLDMDGTDVEKILRETKGKIRNYL